MARLLAAGRSLIGSQTASSRYRMDKRAHLPRFGSSKNPFAVERRALAAMEPISRRQTVSDAGSDSRAIPPTPTPAAAPAARLRQTMLRLRKWCVDVNPMARLAGPARSTFAPTPLFTRAPVQSELCLDRVKVVRNDLSDADLEIVPPKPARSADLARTSEQNAWHRLTTRIFVPAERE